MTICAVCHPQSLISKGSVGFSLFRPFCPAAAPTSLCIFIEGSHPQLDKISEQPARQSFFTQPPGNGTSVDLVQGTVWSSRLENIVPTTVC